MSAVHVVRHLLEEPEDELDAPYAMGPLADYVAPGMFQTNVKDILDHAVFLKQQAEEAGALRTLKPALAAPQFEHGNAKDVDRAFLLIAVRQILEEEEMRPRKIAQILEREMHAIWR